MISLYRDQQKLMKGSTYSPSSYQVHCALYSHDLEANGSRFTYNKLSAFISFGVLETLLVRVHELVICKMITAEPVAAEL